MNGNTTNQFDYEGNHRQYIIYYGNKLSKLTFFKPGQSKLVNLSTMSDVKLLKVRRFPYFMENVIEGLFPPFYQNIRIINTCKSIVRKLCLAIEWSLSNELYLRVSDSHDDVLHPRFRSLADTLARQNVIRNISFPKPIKGWPTLPLAVVGLADEESAVGHGINREEATLKAFAETLERYSFFSFSPQSLIFGTADSIQKRNPVFEFTKSPFSEKQLGNSLYKAHKISTDAEFGWINCKSFLEHKKGMLPAQLVLGSYRCLKDEPVIRQRLTSGIAAGTDLNMSTYNAISELIERDGFMVYWLNKIAPGQIDPNSITNKNIRAIIEIYKKYGINFVIHDFSTDLEVPVFGVTIKEEASGRPAIFISLKCDLDTEKAIYSALLDALRCGYWNVDVHRKKNDHVKNHQERYIFWLDRKRVEDVSFLFEAPLSKFEKNQYAGLDSVQKLNTLKKVLRKNNINIYLSDITTSIAKESSLSVIAAASPDLYPLYTDEHFRYLGHSRIYKAPIAMGILKEPRKESEMNSTPHPFL